MQNIEIWHKTGGSRVLATKYGKSLVGRDFVNPQTGSVEEFILFNQKDWSIVFALTPEKEVLTVVQFKQGCNCVIHELPARTADFEGESPLDVIRRELLEETGHEAGAIHALGPYWIASRSSETRFHCFVATDCRQVGEPKQNPGELIKLEKVALRDWLLQLEDGEITEPGSFIATFRGLLYLGAALDISSNRLSL